MNEPIQPTCCHGNTVSQCNGTCTDTTRCVAPCSYPIPERGPAQCADGHWLGSREHPVGAVGRPLQNGPPTPRSFFFHYNKPASQKAKKPVISVHWQGKCHLCDNVDIRVRTFGRIRPRQPFFIMMGRGVVRIQDGVAHITSK